MIKLTLLLQVLFAYFVYAEEDIFSTVDKPTGYDLLVQLPNLTPILFEFEQLKTVTNPETAYSHYLKEASSSKTDKICDFFSYNGMKTSPVFGFASISATDMKQTKEHLEFLNTMPGCLKVFVSDARHNGSYFPLEDIKQSAKKAEKVFSDAQETIQVYKETTKNPSSHYSNISIQTALKASKQDGKIILNYPKSVNVEVSQSNIFFTATTNSYKINDQFKSNQAILMRLGIEKNVKYFIDEALLKSAIYNGIGTDTLETRYFESDKTGLLCMLGEIIMNGFKTAHYVKVTFEGKMFELHGDDFFFFAKPASPAADQSSSTVSSTSTSTSSTTSSTSAAVSTIDFEKLYSVPVMTMYQKEYLQKYTSDSAYMKGMNIFNVMYDLPSETQSMLTISIHGKKPTQ